MSIKWLVKCLMLCFLVLINVLFKVYMFIGTYYDIPYCMTVKLGSWKYILTLTSVNVQKYPLDLKPFSFWFLFKKYIYIGICKYATLINHITNMFVWILYTKKLPFCTNLTEWRLKWKHQQICGGR